MQLFNELRYAYRQPLLLVASLSVLLLSTVIGLGSLHEKSSSYELFQVYALLQMLVMPAFFAVVAVTTLYRDKTSDMLELIHATPMPFKQRWLSRIAVATCILSTPILLGFVFVCAVFASQVGIAGGVKSFLLIAATGIIQTSFLLMLLAFLLFKSGWSTFSLYAITTAIGVVYVVLGSILGFEFLSGSSILSGSFYVLMLWVDPFGLTSLLDMGATEPKISFAFVANRIFYVVVAIAAFYLLTKSDCVAERVNKQSKLASKQSIKDKTLGFMLPASAFLHLLSLNFKLLLTSKLTPVILIVWASMVVNEVLSTLLAAQAHTLVNSITALNAIAWDVYLLFTSVCLALWSGLICWHNQRQQFADILASAPISNQVKVWVDITTLLVCLLVMTVIMAVVSLFAELMAGSELVLSHYIKQAVLSFIPQALLATFFVCIHNITRSAVKAGLCIFIILVVKFTPITSALGLTHLLWNIAGSPLQAASQTRLFLASEHVFLPFMAFWSLVAVTLCVFAVKLSHRGTGYVTRRQPWSASMVMLPLLVCVLGGMMDYQIRKEKPITYQQQRLEWQADYERTLAHYAQLAQPQITEIMADIALYPAKGKARFELQYRLVNTSDQAISSLLVGRDSRSDDLTLGVIGKNAVINSPLFNQYEITLSQPLAPREAIILTAEFWLSQPMMWPSSAQMVIKPQWTEIAANSVLPVVGYQPAFEIEKNIERAAMGLSEKQARMASSINPIVNTRISTALTHHVQTEGTLVTEWQKADRRFYAYSNPQAVALDFFWLSQAE